MKGKKKRGELITVMHFGVSFVAIAQQLRGALLLSRRQPNNKHSTEIINSLNLSITCLQTIANLFSSRHRAS